MWNSPEEVVEPGRGDGGIVQRIQEVHGTVRESGRNRGRERME